MYEQISRNRRASWLLAGLVVALLAALGYAIGVATTGEHAGGLGLLGVFGIVAIAWSLIGYYAGDKMILAVSGARRVTHDDEPQLFNVVEEMTIAAGLPQAPAVYVLEQAAPNAFATGRDPRHAAVAVTRGLMERLNREEIQGVVAHELSHIRNYDIRFETLVGVLVGMIALIADFFLRWSFWGGMGRRRGGGSSGDQAGSLFAIVALVLAIVAPLAAYAVQFAVSRRREYLADASAVELTRNPLGLARALHRISADPTPMRQANRATAHLYIANPLKKTKAVSSVFDTHPPIAQRIAVLLEMAHAGPEALEAPSTPAGAAERSVHAGDACAVEVAAGAKGAGQAQVRPRLDSVPGLGEAARQRVVRVVVVGHVRDDGRKQLRRAAGPPQGVLGPAQRLPDGVTARLELQRLLKQHGGLGGVPRLEEGHAPAVERVSLALGVEGRLAARRRSHWRRATDRAREPRPASPRARAAGTRRVPHPARRSGRSPRGRRRARTRPRGTVYAPTSP